MSNEEESTGTSYIVSNSETMREPTNLEIAQFISLQASYNTALLIYFHKSHDLMSDEDDVIMAAEATNAAYSSMMFWWTQLLKGEEDEKAE